MSTNYDEFGNVISTAPDDVQLTDSGASPFSLQYYRDKVLNFQAILNALDIAVDSAWDIVAAGANDEITQEIYDWLGDVESKKPSLKQLRRLLMLAQAPYALFLWNFHRSTSLRI